MAQQQRETPIYWDQNATKWNLTLIFSVVVAILGLFMQTVLLVILGIGMAAYSWLTTPRQFLIYRDSMVIVYGIPRTRVISFAEISHIELLSLPLGERLRIRMVSGSRMMLMMRDPGAFRGHLEDALARYHGEQSGSAYVDGAILSRAGDPEFDRGVDDYQDAEVQRNPTTAATTGPKCPGPRVPTPNSTNPKPSPPRNTLPAWRKPPAPPAATPRPRSRIFRAKGSPCTTPALRSRPLSPRKSRPNGPAVPTDHQVRPVGANGP